MRLDGKVALVTGAASGLGAATARRLAEEGARVVVADRLEDEGRALVEVLGRNALFKALDVADEAQWNATVAATMAQFGRVDILVNNAGISPGTLDTFDDEAWARLIAVNARGPFLGMKAVFPHMKAQGSGSIVNISSVAAIVDMGVHLGYGAAKGGVLSMSRSAAVQFASAGIRVNAILPGVMSPMRDSASTVDPTTRNRWIGAIPLARVGRAEDIANAVLFLASDEASYITGVHLPVDGGYTAR